MSKMADRIAGHRFQDIVDDYCLECGRRWYVLELVTREDIGKPDLAHILTLSEREYEEIVAERERREAKRLRAYEAMRDLAAP